MKKILGLDVSSATIGWALLSDDIELLKYGHLKPPSKKKSKDNFSLRLDFAFVEVGNLIQSLNPDVVVIEDYAKRFTKGRSNANTILTLASFNEVSGLISYKLTGKKPIRISVSTLRTIVNNHYGEEINDKDDVLKFCEKHFDNFSSALNQKGNLKKESYDEADAIIVSLGYILSL